MYYDMSGFDYGILDVVQVLHLRKRRGNYYDTGTELSVTDRIVTLGMQGYLCR